MTRIPKVTTTDGPNGSIIIAALSTSIASECQLLSTNYQRFLGKPYRFVDIIDACLRATKDEGYALIVVSHLQR
jgi:hypothetical protein